MIKLQAAARLLRAKDEAPLADEDTRRYKAERLLMQLKKRKVPATLSRVDFSISCPREFRGLCQALELLGWVYEHEPEVGTHDVTMREGDDLIRIMEPRQGWNPVIQILH
jgi:hypothetical protein